MPVEAKQIPLGAGGEGFVRGPGWAVDHLAQDPDHALDVAATLEREADQMSYPADRLAMRSRADDILNAALRRSTT